METKEKNLSFVSHRLWNDKKAYYSLDEVSVLIEDILAYAEALNAKRRKELANGFYRYDYVKIAPSVVYELDRQKKLRLVSNQALLALGGTPDFSALVVEIQRLKSSLERRDPDDPGLFELRSEAPLFNVWITRLYPKGDWEIRKTATVWGRCFSFQIFLIVFVFQGWSSHWWYL